MSCSSPCSTPDPGTVRRRLLVAALAAGATGWLPARAAAVATPAELGAELDDPRLAGQAMLRMFGLAVYEARLWLPLAVQPGELEGDAYAAQPLALELRYARRFGAAAIAERTLVEMRRIGAFGEVEAQRWHSAMLAVFPDVRPGDRLAGVQRPGRSARFHVNGRYAGEIADPLFVRLFFGIWLSPRSSAPALRAALLAR